MIKEGFPLQFPAGHKRTERPRRASFGKHTVTEASIKVQEEVIRLGGKDLIISTNLPLYIGNLPRSGQRNPTDTGVAVYFTLNGKEQCFPCDRWDTVEHNLWAIYKSIEAIRGLDRWGAKDMVESALKGFEALPSPDTVTKMKVRYFSGVMSLEEGKAIYKNLLLELHPDKGGDPNEFMEMQKQYVHFKQSMENLSK